MLKTKIFKVLPYWLIGLILFFGFEVGVILAFGPSSASSVPNNAQSLAAVPQVLGASTSLNGSTTPAVGNFTETQIPDVSQVSAKSFIVFDLNSGQPLFDKNPESKLQIASLTKLMTGLVAYQNTDLNKTFVLSSKDTLDVKPDLGLLPGDSIKALDIFNAMLIGSCNDAAVALADYTSKITGQDFISLMNGQAKNLGMTSSSFSNPVGFDSANNYSTALDLKTLISTTQKFPAFADLGRSYSYEFTGNENKTYSTTATNVLIKNHPDIQAIKTGYTEGALGAMATKVNLDGHPVVILVLDSQDRENDTLILKQQLEQSFKWD